jgi:DNA-binding IclR family transcriptional regulator
MSDDEMRVLNIMRRWRDEGAHWTREIARGAGLATAKAGSVLRGLEAQGKVQRVVTGNPTSWRLSDAN